MNKTAVIIVLVVCIVFIGGVAAISLATEGFGGWFAFGGTRVDIDESAGLSLEGVSEVSVWAPIGKVIVEEGEPGVTLKGYLTVSKKSDQYLFVEKDGGKLSVRFEPGNLPSVSNNRMTLTVRLPGDIAAGLTVRNSSGRVDVKGIRVRDMNVSNSSGSIDVTGCSGGELRVSLSSGNTTVNGADFGSIRVDSQSGNIQLENIVGALSVRHSSGNIDVLNAQGPVEVWHSSGNVSIDAAGKKVSGIDVTLSSGNANLRLDKDASFTLDARTSSGNIIADFDILISGGLSRGSLKGDCNGGGETVKVSVSSGNVNIFKK